MISYIIPAHDEELLLGQTLRALDAAAVAAGEPFEVIVVDDASTDRTAALAVAAGARVVPVAYRQIAATRNAGARAAGGDYFVFIDADTVVNGAVLRAAVRAMRGGAVGGGCVIRFDDPVPPFGRAIERVTLVVSRLLRMACGCFLFCTRGAFTAVGGFDEKLYAAEEVVMSFRLGRVGRFVVLPEAVTTSGRKLRTYTAQEIAGVFGRFALRGFKSVERREDVWYGKRRDDPAVLLPTGRTSVR